MTTCQVCTSKSTLFLCNTHIGELKDNLQNLARGPYITTRKGRTASGGNWRIERRSPGLLDALADVALKRTHMGTGSGHRKKGDEMPSPYEPDTEKGRETAQGRADRLLGAVRNTLSTIVRDVCESRGGRPQRLTNPVAMAQWLAEHVHALACDESAGQWWAEIDGLVRVIEKVIDRPVPIELLGFCATELHNRKPCGAALRAPQDAIEVQCRKCRTVRRCDTVRNMAQSDARRALITWRQVLDTNRMQPDGWRVHDRTLRDWKATGVLKIRGYLRPDGGHGIHRRSDDDEPLYKWADIEQLRTRRVPRGERKRTRAGA